MNVFRRIARIAIAALLATGVAVPGLVSAAPAHAASSDEFCTLSAADGNSYCLNDWNGIGGGGLIKLYPAHNSNETFTEEKVPRCGAGVVTATCPFADTRFDQRYKDFGIVQLRYNNALGADECVATSAAVMAAAAIGLCNDAPDGTGGDPGTIFIDHNGFMISLYWTNKGLYGNDAACMYYPSATSNVGLQVWLDLPTSQGCPVWFRAAA
jgi:hypothetical protein